MKTDIKIEELQEERGDHKYSKEDTAEALAQHFQSAITLPPLPEYKPPVIHTNYCVGSSIRGP